MHSKSKITVCVWARARAFACTYSDQSCRGSLTLNICSIEGVEIRHFLPGQVRRNFKMFIAHNQQIQLLFFACRHLGKFLC